MSQGTEKYKWDEKFIDEKKNDRQGQKYTYKTRE